MPGRSGAGCLKKGIVSWPRKDEFTGQKKEAKALGAK